MMGKFNCYKDRVLRSHHPHVKFNTSLTETELLDVGIHLNDMENVCVTKEMLKYCYDNGYPVVYAKQDKSKRYTVISISEDIEHLKFITAVNHIREDASGLPKFYVYKAASIKFNKNSKGEESMSTRSTINPIINGDVVQKVMKEAKDNSKILAKLELGRLLSKQAKKYILKEAGFFSKKKMNKFIDNPLFDIVLASVLLSANELTVKREEVEYAASALMLSGGEVLTSKFDVNEIINTFVEKYSQFFKEK